MKINMQRDETDKDEKGNISIKCSILTITGILKKSTPDKK